MANQKSSFINQTHQYPYLALRGKSSIDYGASYSLKLLQTVEYDKLDAKKKIALRKICSEYFSRRRGLMICCTVTLYSDCHIDKEAFEILGKLIELSENKKFAISEIPKNKSPKRAYTHEFCLERLRHAKEWTAMGMIDALCTYMDHFVDGLIPDNVVYKLCDTGKKPKENEFRVSLDHLPFVFDEDSRLFIKMLFVVVQQSSISVSETGIPSNLKPWCSRMFSDKLTIDQEQKQDLLESIYRLNFDRVEFYILKKIK